LLATGYLLTNLVSDQPGLAMITNPSLINAWGIALNPATGDFWVSDQGTGVSSLYNGDVNGSPYIKNPAVASLPGALPTGVVFNTTSDFVVHGGIVSAPAEFLFASVTGTIDAFSSAVAGYLGSPSAQTVISTSGAVYTGIAIVNNGAGNFIYAANFHTGKIDVFDKNFNPTGSFTDGMIPAGFAPFNVQNIGGKLYVAFAKPDPMTGRSVPGPGNGFVDVFDANGNVLQRLIAGTPVNPGSPLNSPWAMVLAPANFGDFSNDLLVGNFGDGRINAFNPTTGAFLGTVTDTVGNPLTIPGLWGMTFGNGTTAGNPSTLYFSAGPGGEMHGLLGSLQSAQSKPFAVTSTIVAGAEGAAFSGVVASFGSNNVAFPAGRFTATINWGDGSASSGTLVATGNGGFNVSGTHTFNDEGNFTVTITIGDGTTSSMTHSIIGIGARLPDGTRGTANQLFVAELYQDLLARSVDAGALSGWAGFLDSGGSRAQVVAAIEASAEFRADEVESIYTLLLHRAAEPAAVNSWVGFLSGGGTVEQIAAAVAGSPEYLTNRGGSTNDGFLTALYGDALGRAVDTGSRTAWDRALMNGMTRAQVAALIFSSQEYRADLVGGFYTKYLDRGADPGGLNGVVGQLNMGATDEAAIGLLIGSPEYFNKSAF
jgi:uncharacterized protein (TIGR03118 family)